MTNFWQWLSDNRETVAMLGGGIVAVVTGAWAVFRFVFRAKPKSTIEVHQTGTGLASGGSINIHAPVNVGLDEKKTASSSGPKSPRK